MVMVAPPGTDPICIIIQQTKAPALFRGFFCCFTHLPQVSTALFGHDAMSNLGPPWRSKADMPRRVSTCSPEETFRASTSVVAKSFCRVPLIRSHPHVSGFPALQFAKMLDDRAVIGWRPRPYPLVGFAPRRARRCCASARTNGASLGVTKWKAVGRRAPPH